MLEMRKAEAALKDICRDAIMAMFEEEAAGITTPPRQPSAEEVFPTLSPLPRQKSCFYCHVLKPILMVGGNETHHDEATL